ncbi:MAG: SAM-dependent methyltransferase [Firmicutes bacterium]|nr:SAM-dependent methyltransferase [Bacillota bacterium]
MKITPRLKAIAKKVPPGSVTADIGTDHAYLPVFLVRQGLVPRAIGIEKAEHPLNNARDQVHAAGYSHLIQIRQGYGLEPLAPGEVETAVIAGMGGKTVTEIMDRSPEQLARLKRLILQPMNDVPEVRAWLLDNSWDLVEEDLVREGKMFYFIIVAEPAAAPHLPPTPYSGLEMEIGPLLIRDRHPVLKEYLGVLMAREEKTLASLKNSGRPEVRRQEARVSDRLEELKELNRKIQQER